MSAEKVELGVSHRTDASVSQTGNNAQPEIVRLLKQVRLAANLAKP